MFLALREMRHALVRFGLLVVAIGLLVFLILFQQALQNGLLTAFVGGIRNQSAPVLVYDVDAQRALQGSIITPNLQARIRSADGIGEVGQVGERTFTVRVNGSGESDASLVGTDNATLVHPTTLTQGRQPRSAGEAVGSSNDFSVGDRVRVVPVAGQDPVTIRVVGVARSIQLGVTPTLFTDLGTYTKAVQVTNPGTTTVLPNAIALAPARGTSADELVTAVNRTSTDADALTKTQAADDFPGAAQVRQSFQVIFVLYAVVVPLVTGLFFLIITLQKADSLTLLRAVGARTGVLVRSLLVQVGLVLVLGLLIGIALYTPLSQGEVGGLALQFDVGAVLGWTAVLIVLGLASAAVSLRRVLRIDPLEATVGRGVR